MDVQRPKDPTVFVFEDTEILILEDPKSELTVAIRGFSSEMGT